MRGPLSKEAVRCEMLRQSVMYSRHSMLPRWEQVTEHMVGVNHARTLVLEFWSPIL